MADYVGTSGNDSLFGGATSDNLFGGAGNDLLVDDAGSDALRGEAGDDILWGGAEVDYLFGGEGSDTLSGQGGGDLLSGGTGADRFFIRNGEGIDWVTDFSASQGDRVVFNSGTTFTMQEYSQLTVVTLRDGTGIAFDGQTKASLGNDWWEVFETSGSTVPIFGGSGNVTIIGTTANDTLVGNTGSDAQYGRNGDDILWGGAGIDFLFGGDGSDTLVGQAGGDLMSGGAGADRFYVEGNDWITDFSKAAGDRVAAGGMTYSTAQYGWGTAVTFSNGSVIGLEGVTASSLGTDWII